MSEIPARLLRDLAFVNRQLTYAEKSVLRCLSHGMTQQMAAETIGISRHTVNEQLETAKLKLAAKNQVHTVALALRHGLID